MYVKKRETCRVCGSSNLILVLSLGERYVTNFVEELGKDYIKGPLELVLCSMKNGDCGLLQLGHTLNHDVLYRKYRYKSGVNTAIVKALADTVSSAEKLVKLSSRIFGAFGLHRFHIILAVMHTVS